jgi:hypothetical protein
MRNHDPDFERGGTMIRKLIIIALLAAIAYGTYRWMNDSGFFGVKKQKRPTLEDFEQKALQ